MGSPRDKSTLWCWKGSGLSAGDGGRWRHYWALIGDSNSRDISEDNEVLPRRVSYSGLRMSHGIFEGEKATSFHSNHSRKQTVQLWGKFKERVINELVPQVWGEHRESTSNSEALSRLQELIPAQIQEPSCLPHLTHTLTLISPQNCHAFEILAVVRCLKPIFFFSFLYSYFIKRL